MLAEERATEPLRQLTALELLRVRVEDLAAVRLRKVFRVIVRGETADTPDLVPGASVGHPRRMTEADRRIAELRALVYGREPDPAAVAELRVLLEPVVTEPPAAPRVRRRLRGGAVVGAVALSAVVLASAAWGIGAVGGRAATANPSPSVRVAVSGDRPGPATAVDAATGQTISVFGPVVPCSTGEVDNDSACASANEFQQMLRARSHAQSLAARSRR